MITKEKIANFISEVLNPGILAIIILLVAVLKSKIPEPQLAGWIIAIIVLNGIVPGIIYLFFTSRGYVFDDSLFNKQVQKERIIIFSVFLAIVALELLILVLTNVYQPLLAVFTGGVITLVIGGLITYFWKISVHSTLTTFFVVMLVLLFGWQVWLVILLIPLVFWSRITLARHTFLQLFFGFIFSLAVVLIIFNIFGILSLN